MDKITSIQGKEFDYGDVLLCKKTNEKLVLLLNDREQLLKFTNEGIDAPIAVLPYTEEAYNRLVSQMKQIKEYSTTEKGLLSVEYFDGICVTFSVDNKETIENNIVEQRIARKSEKLASFNESNFFGENVETNSNPLEKNIENEEERRFKVKEISKNESKGTNTLLILKAITVACWSLSTVLSMISNPNIALTALYAIFSVSSAAELIGSIAEKRSLKNEVIKVELNNQVEKGKSI